MSKFGSKLIRWKYVLPRLVILLVIGLAVRWGLDPALKWGLVTGGQSATGAKVEVASLETSLWAGQLDVKDLQVANPNAPMRNLLEASESQLQLDVNALLHGRVVVTDGVVSGLQFDTDREISGALAEVATDEQAGPSVFDPLLEKAGDMGDQWLADLGDRLDTDIAKQLQSPQLAKQLQERWPKQYEALQQQVKDIRERGKTLQATIRQVKQNPLRGLEKLAQLQAELTTLQQQVKQVQQKIAELPKQAEADRQAVLAARKQDEALLRKKLQLGTLDGEGLTQTLLGQPVSEGLASALEWVAWARSQIPSNPAKEKATRSRGTTVVFTPPQPDFLVKLLMLEGTAQMNGQPLSLMGSLTNASSAPRLLAEPTQLVLRGSGPLTMNLNVTLDRRGEIATDKLRMVCPQLQLAGRTLGNANKFAIEMAGGPADMQIDLQLVGDQLTGEILFQQESLQLTPRLAKSPSGTLTKTLDQSLAGVQRLEASVNLAGTLKRPKLTIHSDLGSQVAAGLNASVGRLLDEQKNKLLAGSREQLDAQMQKVKQLQEQAQQELLANLGEGQELLGQLAALTGGGNKSGLPGGIPQLGKSLRFDDVLKK